MTGWWRRNLFLVVAAMLRQSAEGWMMVPQPTTTSRTSAAVRRIAPVWSSRNDPEFEDDDKFTSDPSAFGIYSSNLLDDDDEPPSTTSPEENETTKNNKEPVLPNSPQGYEMLQQNVRSSSKRDLQQAPDVPERFLGNPHPTEGTQAQRYEQDPSRFRVARSPNPKHQPPKIRPIQGAAVPDQQDQFFHQPYQRVEGEQARKYKEDPSKFEIYTKKHHHQQQSGQVSGATPDDPGRFLEKPSLGDSASQADRFRDDPIRFDRNQQLDRYQQDPSNFQVYKKKNMEQQHWNLRQGTMHFVDDPSYMASHWNRFEQDPTVPYNKRSGQVERFRDNPNRFEVYKPPQPWQQQRPVVNNRQPQQLQQPAIRRPNIPRPAKDNANGFEAYKQPQPWQQRPVVNNRQPQQQSVSRRKQLQQPAIRRPNIPRPAKDNPNRFEAYKQPQPWQERPVVNNTQPQQQSVSRRKPPQRQIEQPTIRRPNIPRPAKDNYNRVEAYKQSQPWQQRPVVNNRQPQQQSVSRRKPPQRQPQQPAIRRPNIPRPAKGKQPSTSRAPVPDQHGNEFISTNPSGSTMPQQQRNKRENPNQDPNNQRFEQDPGIPYKFAKDQQIERFEQDPNRFVRYKRPPSSPGTMPDQVNEFITNPYGIMAGHGRDL